LASLECFEDFLSRLTKVGVLFWRIALLGFGKVFFLKFAFLWRKLIQKILITLLNQLLLWQPLNNLFNIMWDTLWLFCNLLIRLSKNLRLQLFVKNRINQRINIRNLTFYIRDLAKTFIFCNMSCHWGSHRMEGFEFCMWNSWNWILSKNVKNRNKYLFAQVLVDFYSEFWGSFCVYFRSSVWYFTFLVLKFLRLIILL